MYLRSPVTTLVKVEFFSIFKIVCESVEPFIRYNSLNLLIIPFLESGGGNCQDAVILVEEVAVTVRLVGAFVGTAIKKLTVIINMLLNEHVCNFILRI